MYLKTDSGRRLLVVSCAGMDMRLAGRSNLLRKMDWRPLKTVFPAVTSTAQATLRTGLAPEKHGILANGRYDRAGCRVEFWGQSGRVMPERRIWDGLRARGGRVGVMFHQQSLGDSADFVLSPAPIHRHGGGMVEALHCKPPELERALRSGVNGALRLSKYWGPMASAEVGEWCASATAAVMERHAPELLLTYLPDMDYVLQREGPEGGSVQRELDIFASHVEMLLEAADRFGYGTVFWGDYPVRPVNRVLYPNRILADTGLFTLREAGGRLYPNLYDSMAFAMVDHQVAHVYVRSRESVEDVAVLFSGVPGIGAVFTPEQAGLAHSACGDLVLAAEKDSWFSYHWWKDDSAAPDYAAHVDIHSKIGYDPCELFWGFPFFRTSLDCGRVRGSHGLADAPAAFAATGWAECLKDAGSLLELTAFIEKEV